MTVGTGTKPQVKRLHSGPPSSAVYIGNSFFYYNNGVNQQVLKLLTAAEPTRPWRSTMITISGSGLDWHDVDSYFRPNAVGRYSFDPDNNVVFNDPKTLFDVAIVMDSSQGPVHPQLAPVFDEYTARNAASIRRHGAEPVFFMTWAYADAPDMTGPLAERYTQAGNAQNALVIPAGLAFARALSKRPELSLHVDDKRHPNLNGTYLAGCTVYACLFGKSPQGLAWDSGLDRRTAAFFQDIAWETVCDYYGA
ncbi:MAG: hypothetical protein AB7F96_19190 [Beijerinckiaceae bacterium]